MAMMAEGPTPVATAAGTLVKKEALPKLLDLLSPVAHLWDLFAQQIGVPFAQISQIKVATTKSGPDYLYKCLTQALEWWEANDSDPVYERMIDVLDPEIGKTTPVMNRALARALREFMGTQRDVNQIATAIISTAAVSPGLHDPTAVKERFTQTNEAVIRAKFACLLEFVEMKLQHKLEAEKIERKLQLFVVRLFNVPGNSVPVSSDVSVIFETMRSLKLLTYLNIAGLEQIIKHFCADDSEAESKMEQYKKDLSGFELATKIKDSDYISKARSTFPDLIATSPAEILPKQTPAYLKELAVKLEHCVADYHLDYLRELWKLLSTVLSLPPLYLILDAVIMNSVLVVWLIPTDVVSEATERAKQNADFFKNHPILKVTIGDDCVYSKAEPTRMQRVIEWSRKTDERFCFVVVGETGAGKSTLLNSLANKDIAETGGRADSVTEEVQIYDEEIEVPQQDGTNLKLKVRAVDTPGIDSLQKTYEELLEEVSKKVPQLHALFYCVNISDRFRLSSKLLLSAMSRWYGVDIWKRVVIVLTHADTVRTPMKCMESHKKVIVEFLTDEMKLDGSVVSNIPFCLVAQYKESFFPPDYPIGEGQITEYDWKMELLSAVVSVVPPEIAPMILKLHEKGVWEWLKRNQHLIVGATSLAFIVALTGPQSLAVVSMASTAGFTSIANATGATVVGVISSVSSLFRELYDKYKEGMQKWEAGHPKLQP